MLIKTQEQIKKDKSFGKILASVAKELKKNIFEGVVLKDLDTLARKLIQEAGAEPAFWAISRMARRIRFQLLFALL